MILHRILSRLVEPQEPRGQSLGIADISSDPRFPGYRASCFAYVVAGLLRLRKSRVCGSLLIAQSLLSYMSDVKTLGAESAWHPADRLAALVTCAALKSLDESQSLYKSGDRRFMTAHTRWHLAALVLAVL